MHLPRESSDFASSYPFAGTWPMIQCNAFELSKGLIMALRGLHEAPQGLSGAIHALGKIFKGLNKDLRDPISALRDSIQALYGPKVLAGIIGDLPGQWIDDIMANGPNKHIGLGPTYGPYACGYCIFLSALTPLACHLSEHSAKVIAGSIKHTLLYCFIEVTYHVPKR